MKKQKTPKWLLDQMKELKSVGELIIMYKGGWAAVVEIKSIKIRKKS